MTFSDAIQSIVGSDVTRNAAKRPSWRGYVTCRDYQAPNGSTPESYKIVLVTSASTSPDATSTTTTSGTDGTAGTADDVGTYVLVWNGSVWTMPSSASSQLVVDAQLWAGLISDDWIIGAAAEFETVRAGGDGRW